MPIVMRIEAILRQMIWLRGALGLLRRGGLMILLRLLLKEDVLPVIGVKSFLVELLALRLYVIWSIVSDPMNKFT